ncbi:N,N-dimethylformamidase beta subunit family domain-containing protein, partial [Bradyrhizobium sp. WSM1743]|uniref:N,N-dimethylformamidase beta subunit family domain-containing protein n=1 Tax=Bradyrhizobium sp. WSM1743 TaxID=318996 RepID=UPI0012EBA4C3
MRREKPILFNGRGTRPLVARQAEDSFWNFWDTWQAWWRSGSMGPGDPDFGNRGLALSKTSSDSNGTDLASLHPFGAARLARWEDVAQNSLFGWMQTNLFEARLFEADSVEAAQASAAHWQVSGDSASRIKAAAGDCAPSNPSGAASWYRRADGLDVHGSLSVIADKSDYAPGSTATFTATGLWPGASIKFQIADLSSAPGANGIADIYTPFTIKDGGAGDLDGRADGTVVAEWQVPADGRATSATLQLTATSGGQTSTTTFADAGNKIVTENSLAGTPQSTWAIHGSIANQGDSQIEGFATQISTNGGQTVSFKIDTASSVKGYTLDIYRLGYYGGNGARLITSMHHTGTANQPNPIFNSATRTVDAGNWSVTDSWAIPSTAVSGVYFAKLTTDTGNYQNIIPFIVRNDGTTSDLLFQTSDETWQAYNPWGGYNLYTGPSGAISDRAYAVSYNRPIAINATTNDAGPQSFMFGEEFAAIYWLEENGYNVNYISGIDAATNPGLLRNTKIYLDVGHDEYWTQSQFANVMAARDAGVNEAFLSGNEIYWDCELAPSFDASHTANRTLVQYKDVASGTQLDPNGTANGGAGLFRDPVYGPGTPENALSGTIFTVNDSGALFNITIPASMSQLRFWNNTSIDSNNGGTLVNLLGYEWDSDLDNGFRPAGLIDMSSTTMNTNQLLVDNGANYGSGTATHSLTLYRDPESGALVFGAGTVMWSWGFDDQHTLFHGITAPVSRDMQQAMVNLFADMGVQPQTLLASLVMAQASADHSPPTSTITSPGGGTTFSQGQSVTVTGTATDSGGGIVGGIEVSTDGGTTWHPATGTSNWSYTFAISGAGTHLIEARATDDSINLQTTPATVSVNVTGSNPLSLFTASNTPAQTNKNDGTPLEVGVKFTSSSAGQITALKFYRSPGDTGTDLLDLWSATGTKLASATFTNTTATGWQTVTLATPVSIAANTT